MFYVNKKGNQVPLTLTEHARRRFALRWKKLHGEKAMRVQGGTAIDDLNEAIETLFKAASRVKATGKRYQERLKKHGKDTLYFKADQFTFVVQNGIIKTIEISTKTGRELNKKPFDATALFKKPLE
jgi:hypothetical protein